MTTDPRVEAAARELHRLEYGGATDWDADGSLHSAFYLAAEAILAAADAARVVPADVAGLVDAIERRLTPGRPDNFYTIPELLEKTRAALTALAKRAVVAEENDRISREYLATATARAETAERRLAVATEALTKIERAPAWGAPGGDAGPYTCTRCTQATWNDDDLCDACWGGDDA